MPVAEWGALVADSVDLVAEGEFSGGAALAVRPWAPWRGYEVPSTWRTHFPGVLRGHLNRTEIAYIATRSGSRNCRRSFCNDLGQ